MADSTAMSVVGANVASDCRWCQRELSLTVKRRRPRGAECATCSKVIYKKYSLTLDTSDKRKRRLGELNENSSLQQEWDKDVADDEMPSRKKYRQKDDTERAGLDDKVQREEGASSQAKRSVAYSGQ